jgi:hypothetical protein
MSFHEDLAFGDKWELYALQKLNIRKYRKMKGKFSPFDIVCYTDSQSPDPEDGFVFREFKADRISARTGFLAIEWSCASCPAGIQVTGADFWTYCVVKGDEADVYDIPVSVLKEMIHNQKFDKITQGGDDNKTILFLFSIELFAPYKA